MARLTQVGAVAEYVQEFEELSSQIYNVDDEML